MNEKEYKEAAAKGGTVCSITGRPCKCDGGGSCRGWRSSVDNLPNELVRRVKTALLRVDIAQQAVAHCVTYDEYERQYPGPELRDINRRLDAIVSTLEEILK